MLPSARPERLAVMVIVAAYLLIATGYSLGPIFEGPDEIEHYRYARTLAATVRLPHPEGQLRGEYHQAPLYYLLVAPVARLAGSADFAEIDGRLNPYYGANIHVVGSDNKNIYLHRRAENFPYSGSPTARAVHLVRLVSVLLGAGTLIAAYGVFGHLWPDHPPRRVLALGLAAFWPQFGYLCGTVNNDTLLIFLATLSLYALLRQRRDGPTRRCTLVLGAILGALLLS